MQLKPYQKETVHFGLKNPYAILGLDPGLGKSLCALEIWRQTKCGQLVIVCPAYLVLNWKNEILKWYGDRFSLATIQKGCEVDERLNEFDVIIVSYTLCQKAEFLFKKSTFLIVDEAQNLASMQAKRTEFIHRVVYENSIHNVYLLTGTPIKNRVQEFYSLIALCNYLPSKPPSDFLDRFPDSIKFADYFSYREQYQIQIGTRQIPIIKWSGVKNKEELRAYLTNCYIRFESKNVLDLEPYVEKDVLISEKSDEKLLAEFENYFAKGENASVASNFKALAALKKVPFTVQYAAGIVDEIGHCIVFSDHVEAAREIARGLETKKIKVCCITGQTTLPERIRLAGAFQSGEIDVICATIGAFSTGVNLTRTNQMIFNDLSFVPANNKQSTYRIQRIGQRGQCVIAYILGSPQDLVIRHALDEKMKTISEVT